MLPASRWFRWALPETASAGIIYGPVYNGFLTFTDIDTSLSWLRLDSFTNTSHDDMAAAVEAAGFTVATRSDVETLLGSLPIFDSSDWTLYANIMGRAPVRNLIWGSYGPVDANGNIGWANAFDFMTVWNFDDSAWAFGLVGASLRRRRAALA